MLKENSSTNKLIEYIHSLPAKEQREIGKVFSEKKPVVKKKVDKKGDFKRFQAFVDKHRFNLPPDYKFDREEANER